MQRPPALWFFCVVQKQHNDRRVPHRCHRHDEYSVRPKSLASERTQTEQSSTKPEHPTLHGTCFESLLSVCGLTPHIPFLSASLCTTPCTSEFNSCHSRTNALALARVAEKRSIVMCAHTRHCKNVCQSGAARLDGQLLRHLRHDDVL